jgi:hypothetical protein
MASNPGGHGGRSGGNDRKPEIALPSAKSNWMTTDAVFRGRGGRGNKPGGFWDKAERSAVDHRNEDVLFRGGRTCTRCGLAGHPEDLCTNENFGLVEKVVPREPQRTAERAAEASHSRSIRRSRSRGRREERDDRRYYRDEIRPRSGFRR